MFAKLKLRYKIKHNKPIYRKDVLRYAKCIHNDFAGLCGLIDHVLSITLDEKRGSIKRYFPLFGTNVWTCNGNVSDGYWWSPNRWDTGRMDYLNWLIKQYKDDKTDLRKL